MQSVTDQRPRSLTPGVRLWHEGGPEPVQRGRAGAVPYGGLEAHGVGLKAA